MRFRTTTNSQAAQNARERETTKENKLLCAVCFSVSVLSLTCMAFLHVFDLWTFHFKHSTKRTFFNCIFDFEIACARLIERNAIPMNWKLEIFCFCISIFSSSHRLNIRDDWLARTCTIFAINWTLFRSFRIYALARLIWSNVNV